MPGLYGGGHNTQSALDLVYWCQYNCTQFYDSQAVFVAPSAPLEVSWPYQTIASCVEQAGITGFPLLFNELMAWLRANNALVSTEKAATTRGALLLNRGTVSVSLGDRRRLIVEENFRLAQRWMDPKQNLITTFQYGALIPGVVYG